MSRPPRPSSHPTRLVRVGAVLAAFGVLGCGAGEPEAPALAPSPGPSAPSATNEPPVIERLAIRPATPAPGDTLVADVGAVDPDGDALRLTYTWQLNGRTIGGDSDRLTLTDAPKGSLVELRVVAVDLASSSAPATAVARVGNQPPRIDSVELEPDGELHGEQDLRARVRASDPDRDELAIEHRWWIDGQLLEARGPQLPATSFERGQRIELVIVASDGELASEEWRGGPFVVGNAPPEITSSPEGVGTDGRFRYEVRASDPDGDTRFGYRLLSGPPGMAIDPVDGVVRYEALSSRAGSYEVAIEVDDRHGGRTTQRFQLDVRDEAAAAPASPERTP